MNMKEEVIAVDIETYDPHLKDWGPGSMRKDGYIIGIGIYSNQLKGFFRPEDQKVVDILKTPTTKVFHNGVYDLDWIMNGAGLEVNGRCEDTMTRETLLDSYAFSYALDSCCQRHGIEGKNKADTIDSYWKAIGGKGKAVEHLNEVPFDIVGKYCIQDCKATYDLFYVQQPLLEQQDLLRANDIEVRLYPLLMNMRKNGFRLQIPKLLQMSDVFTCEYDTEMDILRSKYGIPSLSLNSANDLYKIWKQEGLPIEYTTTGKPSFTADILENCNHPVAEKIHYLKGLIKANAFLDSWVDLSYHNHLYPSFYPAKRDVGGTVTGRWSSANPNCQQIPARADKHGEEIRSLFIPEDGCLLGAFDFKQIEYRVFTHFAQGPGAKEAQAQFHDHDVDYHQMVQEMMGWVTGDKKKDKEFRHITKNLNFGSIYGLGPRSFAQKFHKQLLMSHPNADPDNLTPLATSLMNEYFAKIPFVKPTCNKIMDVGQRRGFVKTLSGRRQRMPLDGGAYKLINYLIQGSAADILKKGLVDAWEQGVFNTLKLHATVHDESVFSLPRTREGYEACLHFYKCLVSSYELNIPLGVDTEIGPDWGHCDEDNWNNFKKEVIDEK